MDNNIIVKRLRTIEQFAKDTSSEKIRLQPAVIKMGTEQKPLVFEGTNVQKTAVVNEDGDVLGWASLAVCKDIQEKKFEKTKRPLVIWETETISKGGEKSSYAILGYLNEYFGETGISYYKNIQRSTQELYPEIYFSSPIERIWEEVPPLPDKPFKPIKPKFRLDLGRGIGIVFFVAFFIICLIAIENYEPIVIAFLFFMCGGSCLWIYLNAKNEYKKELESFRCEESEYYLQLRIYDQEREKRLSENYLNEYRKNLLSGWLHGRESGIQSVPHYCDCKTSDIVKKGVSEKFFYNRLKEHFSNYTVRDNIKIPVGYSYYYPDIALFIEGLYIDIEIDEPYTEEGGEPIHYLDFIGDERLSSDIERNTFFQACGWEVIRFSEEQIVNYPSNCVQFIEGVVRSCLYSDPSLFVSHCSYMGKWTKNQAVTMSKVCYRNSYLESMKTIADNTISKIQHPSRSRGEVWSEPPEA